MITKQASCSVRPRRQLVALGLLVAASTLDARADVCSGALPDPGLDRAAEAGKFALIAAACDLAPAAAPRAAAQLSLYERGSTTITLAIPAPGSDLAPPTPAPPSSPPSAPAPGSDRDIERILSVEPAFVAAARAYGVDPLLL
ncbi:MAG TPA: hypothetical protein VMU33_08460, partial [Burkholderiaceae bacterium]|nr:hypothetical protein [Burkholderiaceae bacterium]